MNREMNIASLLEEARARSLGLLEPLPDAALVNQHSSLMSPLIWDLGHVANYEEQWLVRALTGEIPARPELDDLYDAFRHPRRDRHALPMPGPAETRAYAAAIRRRALAVLATLDRDGEDPLLRDGFVHLMVVQHEHQHDETMLAALQLLPAPGYRPVRAPMATSAGAKAGETLLPGGAFTMGTSNSTNALDNERPAHVTNLAPFWLDTHPVTNGEYAAFIAETGADRPQAWNADGSIDRFGWAVPIQPDEPVQHVSWHEATRYTAWAGKRLPTEAEWEFAASNGGADVYPWGAAAPTPAVADLWYAGGSAFGPSRVGSHPDGADRWGVHDLIGGVWEWTSSSFGGYPGFVAFPYREYSEVFFGDEYKVLRGGSWGTHPSAMRATFRNWDYPIRRQIFSGFRCARDA
jgi:iron(II)-dependent oxidoreductase